MSNTGKQLLVSALENGTVIDHIPSEHVYRTFDILGLKGMENQITVGINLNSKHLGKKGIIKIADKFFADDELNTLAILAPNATVNIIRDFKVVEKKHLAIPAEIEGVVRCMNPKCITNHQNVRTKFSTVSSDGEISLQCHYCEKITTLK